VPDSPTVSLRMDQWMLTKLRKMAADDRRTVGAVIRLLLERQLMETERKNGRG
jgi:hypothetical protein